jgi:hypothetical protein
MEKMKSFSVRKETKIQLTHALFDYEFLLMWEWLNNNQSITLQIDWRKVIIHYVNMFWTKDYGKTSYPDPSPRKRDQAIWLEVDDEIYYGDDLWERPDLVCLLGKALDIAAEDFEKEWKTIVESLNPELEARDSVRRLREKEISELGPVRFKKLMQKDSELNTLHKTPFSLQVLDCVDDNDDAAVRSLEYRLKESKTDAQVGVITYPYLKKWITREFMVSWVSNKPISSMDYLNCRGLAIYGENTQWEWYGFLTHIDVTKLMEENDPEKITFLCDIIEERYAELREIIGSGPIYIGAAWWQHELWDMTMKTELEFINKLLRERLGRWIDEILTGPTPLPKNKQKRTKLFKNDPFYNAQAIFFDPGAKELSLMVRINRPTVFNTPHPYNQLWALMRKYNNSM